MSDKPFQTFSFSAKNKMLGLLMVQDIEELKQEITVTDEERFYREFPGVVKEHTIETGGKTLVTIKLDLCNQETMEAIWDYYGGGFTIGHYSDPRILARIRKMRDDNLTAYQVGWKETMEIDKIHPFSSNAVIGRTPVNASSLFNSLNSSLGEKAMLVVYAYDIKPGVPNMFFVGSKQAKKNGLLNMTQWRDTTEEEGLRVFNTFRDDLSRIGREFMYS